MSPFLTYTEVMPSKPSKELVGFHLPKFLQHLADNNPQLAEDERIENSTPQKRKKLDKP